MGILLFLQSRLLFFHLLLSLPHLIAQKTVIRVIRPTAFLQRHALTAPVNSKFGDSGFIGQYGSAGMSNKGGWICSSPFLLQQLLTDDVVHVVADSYELLPFQTEGYYDGSHA